MLPQLLSGAELLAQCCPNSASFLWTRIGAISGTLLLIACTFLFSHGLRNAKDFFTLLSRFGYRLVYWAYKAGKPDSAISLLSAGLGRHKSCCNFQEYTEWKVNGKRVGGVLAAKEMDAMGGCTLAVFLQLFQGVIGILY